MTKEKLENLWRTYSSMVTEYKEEKLPSELMTKPAKKAAVKSKNINTALECTEYVLENGVRIIVKKTNFEKDKVYMSAFSEGGSALYDNDKERMVCRIRLERETASLQEIANILSEQLGKEVTKSNINHIFRALHQLYLRLSE